MGTWIDFKQLREQLDFAIVLQHYRVAIKLRGTQGTAHCPLPGHPRDAKSSPSFSVSFQKKVFQCFGCRASGNAVDFVAHMEGLNPRDPLQFRKAALIAQERFLGTNPVPRDQAPSKAVVWVPPIHRESSVIVNEPLDFELKNLDPCLPQLLQRGFTEETIRHFGLGLCTKGTFAGRIAIPLHDLQGRLIGYAGRTVYDEAIDAEHPKYLYPSRRQREGQVLEFSKSLFVYSGHRIQSPAHNLVVVQGFPSVWWLWQHGYHDVVALMSAACSVDQANAIASLTVRSARVWCFTNADNGSENCAQSLFRNVGPHRFCKWVPLQDKSPTQCDAEDLAGLLEGKIDV